MRDAESRTDPSSKTDIAVGLDRSRSEEQPMTTLSSVLLRLPDRARPGGLEFRFMAHQPPPRHPSRRAVLTAGSTLLGGFGLGVLRPGTSSAAVPGNALPTSQELAAYRPVEVSSTAYAPTPGSFVVD